MGNLQRYVASDLGKLMDQINRNAIGMDGYFDRLFDLHETTQNYPPYNLVQVSNVESDLKLHLLDLRRIKFMYTQNLGNYSSKDNEKMENPKTPMPIVALLKGLSPAVGHSLMILR